MPDRTRHRIKICGGGGPASHIDQGRHSRFTARGRHYSEAVKAKFLKVVTAIKDIMLSPPQRL